MRDANNIRVEHAIVHNLDPLQDRLILSDAELSLADEPQLQQYFDAQVEDALNDNQSQAAVFSKEDTYSTGRICFDILNGTLDFVDGSRKLATRLFEAGHHDKRIAPGIFLVGIYSASNYVLPFLALLKLDLTSAIVPSLTTTSRQMRDLKFSTLSVLPTVTEKLQKAALIHSPNTLLNYDLLLLDRQSRNSAARYFSHNFLNALPALDARTRTRRFFIAVQSAKESLRSSLTPEQSEDLQTQLDAALQLRSVNTKDWVDALDLPTYAKNEIQSNLDKQLPDTVIDIDLDYAKNGLVEKLRFRGDFGTVFEVETARFSTIVKERQDYTQSDGTQVTRLVIEVPNLRQVMK